MCSPAPPQGLELGSTPTAVQVAWKAPDGPPPKCYRIRAQYFDVESPFLDKPLCEANVDADGHVFGKALEHPAPVFEADGSLRGCTVQVTVTAVGHGNEEGGSVQRKTTWLHAFKDEQVARKDLQRCQAKLLEVCADFARKKGRDTVRLLVVGSQHHGKSTFVNHLVRCAKAELDVPDEMATAPPGTRETTLHTKRICVRFGNFVLELIDMPAFSTVTDDRARQFEAGLAQDIPDGTRRADFTQVENRLFALAPPDAAIIIVASDQFGSEIREYLSAVAAKLKNASGGKVAFPYVVAVTKVDRLLRVAQGLHPHKDLMTHLLQEVKVAANTEQVAAIASYKRSSRWSRHVNHETYRLLCDVVNLAKNENTGAVVAKHNDEIWCQVTAAAAVLVVLIALLAALDNKQQKCC